MTPLICCSSPFCGVAGALESPGLAGDRAGAGAQADLMPAIVANSVNFNISRVIGPALGGIVIAACGHRAPFWLNAVSNLGVVGALIWWRRRKNPDAACPPNASPTPIAAACATRGTTAFARDLIRARWVSSSSPAPIGRCCRWSPATGSRGGPELYGVLLGAIGTGALASAFVSAVAAATAWAGSPGGGGHGRNRLAMTLYGLARDPFTALAASLIAGASWIAVLSAINVSAQLALPEWVRARGLALYVMVMFGALTLGSVIWGKLARGFGPARRPFRGGRRSAADRAAHLAVEIADRARRRSGAVDALARAGHRA